MDGIVDSGERPLDVGFVEVVERVDESASVSVSEPERSSSQESATGADLGFAIGLCGDLAESLRVDSVLITSVSLVRAVSGGNTLPKVPSSDGVV